MIDSEKSTTFSKNILLYVKTILNNSLINKMHSSITNKKYEITRGQFTDNFPK